MSVLQVFPKSRIIEVPSAPSTNKLAEDLLSGKQLSEPTTIYPVNNGSVYWTPVQTAGIGQAENRWESEPHKNLTATVVTYPDFLDAADQFYLTVVASLSVSDVVNDFVNQQIAAIKWPNDIFCNHRKIAGILIKNFITAGSVSASIAGVGLNINQTSFKEAPQAVSLKILTGRDFEISRVLTKWHDLYASYYSLLQSDKQLLMKLYLERMYMRDVLANYLIGEKIVTARITGVDKWGLLVLKDERGKSYTCGLKEIVYPPLAD